MQAQALDPWRGRATLSSADFMAEAVCTPEPCRSRHAEYLRQHFGGEENATRMRQMRRGAWVGVLGGVTMIAAQYFLGSYVPLP